MAATKIPARDSASHSSLTIAWPDCESDEAMVICLAELKNLAQWAKIVECSECEFEIDPRELAGMVRYRLDALVQLLDVVKLCEEAAK